MAKKFQELIDEMPPAKRARHEAGVQRLLAELHLDELRRAMKLSQETLAKRLKTDQAQISRLEQRADLLVSTLRRYVEALGGELAIIATFRTGGAVTIKNFRDLEPVKARPRSGEGAQKRPRKRAARV